MNEDTIKQLKGMSLRDYVGFRLRRANIPLGEARKVIVMVNGKPEAGKDELMDAAERAINRACSLREPWNSSGLTSSLEYPKYHRAYAQKISRIDSVKESAKILGWDGKKDEKGRKFLSYLAILAEEAYHGPNNAVIKSIGNSPIPFWFVCAREAEHILYLKESFAEKGYTVLTLLIESSRSLQSELPADRDVGFLPGGYDLILYNEGTLEEWRDLSSEFGEVLVGCFTIV